MPKIVTNIFSSVDGIVDADGDWQFPYFDHELFEWVGSAWDRASAVLVGRRSFDGYERLRADHPDSPALTFLDATPTYVVSRTMTDPPREGVVVIGMDAERRIRELRRRVQQADTITQMRQLYGRGLGTLGLISSIIRVDPTAPAL